MSNDFIETLNKVFGDIPQHIPCPRGAWTEVACGTLDDVQVKDHMHNLHTVLAVAGGGVTGTQSPRLVDRSDASHRHDDVLHACKLWQDDKFVLFTAGVVFDTTPAGTHDGIRSSGSSYIDWSKNRWYVTTVQNWADAGLPAIA